MSGELIVFLIAILIVGVLIFVAINITKKRPAAFDREEYQTDFLSIENTLTRENELSWNAVVTDADKLLDKPAWRAEQDALMEKTLKMGLSPEAARWVGWWEMA